MNPPKILRTEVVEVQALFQAIYSMARRAAGVRSAAVALATVAPYDREDLQQEALAAVWRALPSYDPSRASLRTFVERVVASRVCSFVRSANRRPTSQPLDLNSDHGVHSDIGQHELRTDIERLLMTISDSDRRLALLLMEHTPSEAGRILRVARSTVYERIQKLRARFAGAGLGPPQFGHPSGRPLVSRPGVEAEG
jgi:RNA polymerase sigma factor (sigma-70 family)